MGQKMNQIKEITPETIAITESRKSVRGEQAVLNAPAKDSIFRQTESAKAPVKRPDTTLGDKIMTKRELRDASKSDQVEETSPDRDNVLEFSATLRELKKQVDPNLVKQREGWRDSNGNVRMVEYVEWHTVADIL